ncbi:hypothetical protein GCM10009854_38530 [Saccharopolyspora halophila]|uniref:Secreted protein n=1 Tax=Saccharopolyspora halophila TaxID=405551 RepID=A0ABP5TMM9_9PSEU
MGGAAAVAAPRSTAFAPVANIVPVNATAARTPAAVRMRPLVCAMLSSSPEPGDASFDDRRRSFKVSLNRRNQTRRQIHRLRQYNTIEWRFRRLTT